MVTRENNFVFLSLHLLNRGKITYNEAQDISLFDQCFDISQTNFFSFLFAF